MADAAEIARKQAEDRATRVLQLRRMLYAERVTRILCRRSGAVAGYRWRAPSASARGVCATSPTSFRVPPLPFHQMVHKGAGWCRVCGQPIYGGGSFRKFAGPVSKLTWHNACLSTYFLMTKPSDYTELLLHRQGERCALSGDPIPLPYRHAEVDHEVPLFRVAREHAEEPWHELIRFWGFANLRAITRPAHLAKCKAEAQERARHRSIAAALEAVL